MWLSVTQIGGRSQISDEISGGMNCRPPLCFEANSSCAFKNPPAARICVGETGAPPERSSARRNRRSCRNDVVDEVDRQWREETGDADNCMLLDREAMEAKHSPLARRFDGMNSAERAFDPSRRDQFGNGFR